MRHDAKSEPKHKVCSDVDEAFVVAEKFLGGYGIIFDIDKGFYDPADAEATEQVFGPLGILEAVVHAGGEGPCLAIRPALTK